MGNLNQYLMSLRLDGRYEELIKHASEELDRNPNDSLIWEMLSEAFLRTNKLESAERACLSCLKIQPQNQLAICYLITVYLRFRDFPNCHNAINLYFSSLDESHKDFLVHEFTVAMEAGVVFLEELPINIRKYAEGIVRIMRNDIKIEKDPKSAFYSFLKDGNSMGAMKTACRNNSLFTVDAMVDLIQKNDFLVFENFLALGLPALGPKDLTLLENEISKSKSTELEQIATAHRIFDTSKNTDDHNLELILSELLHFCFSYRPMYHRTILKNQKERKISFGIGQCEVATKSVDRLLPEILGLVRWSERSDQFEVRDLYGLSDRTRMLKDELVVLTFDETRNKGSCLKVDSDDSSTLEFCSWNIKQIWTLQIMEHGKFLELLGADSIHAKNSVIAFNFLSEGMLGSNLEFKSGVLDRLKMSYPKANEFAKRLGFRAEFE